MQRLLLTGGSGLLATNWACFMRDQCEVMLVEHDHRVRLERTRSVRMDLEHLDALRREIDRLEPDIVIHTAGLTNVDQCERDASAAHRLNAVLARNVALACAERQLALVHLSTDHLFSGKRAMVTELEPPAPQNEYARSKHLAEQWVLENAPQALVVRTNFFGWGHASRRSFTDWIIETLRAGESLNMFDDVFFSPIYVDVLAHVCHQLLRRSVGGIVHVTGDQRISKYEFAMMVAEVFGLPTSQIRRSSVSAASLAAARPQDMSLDNGLVRGQLGHGLGSPRQFIEQLLLHERAGRAAELLDAVA